MITPLNKGDFGMLLKVSIDAGEFKRLANLLAAAGDQAPHGIRRGLNRAGEKARTQMKRALVAQTGLKSKTIQKALVVRKAPSGSAGSYEISSKGGDISLKYFGARETRKGVSAAPRSKRAIFGQTFIKGGAFPDRKSWKNGGHVFGRVGGGRLPIEKQRSGVFIPTEMVTGNSAAAFNSAARTHLVDEIARELLAILSGTAPRGRAFRA